MSENEKASGEVMGIETPVQNDTTVSAQELMENIEKPNEDEAPQGKDQDADANPYAADLQTLYDDGWTQEDMAAFIVDPQALREIRDGKTVRQAAFAFMRRQSAVDKAHPAKKGVPTVRATATAGASRASRIAEMSDEEFAELSQKARAALMEGKKVTFD